MQWDKFIPPFTNGEIEAKRDRSSQDKYIGGKPHALTHGATSVT